MLQSMDKGMMSKFDHVMGVVFPDLSTRFYVTEIVGIENMQDLGN